MCIIVAKPAGVNIPDEGTFDQCYTSNRDGIGMAYNLPDQKPTISKGFFNVKKLMKMFQTHEITKEHNLIVHFRFTTHGKTDQGNCHPFPLSPSFDDMRLLHCECDTAIAHNGVFGSMPASEKHSDTMKFIGGVLAQPEIIENLDSKAVKELVRGYCGYSSKLAFLRANGLKLIGEFEQEDGVYYSNRQYKKYVYAPNNNWEKNSLGQDWCYVHKKYDYCEWCLEHKAMDTCEHDADVIKKFKTRFADDNKKIIHLGNDCCSNKITTLQCDVCMGIENVKWNNDEQGFMCAGCEREWGLNLRADY